MVSCEQWIAIDLSADYERLHEVARGRQDRAERDRVDPYGRGDFDTNLCGVLGEAAFAVYKRVMFEDLTRAEEADRGFDVAGYQVRCGSSASYGLNLKLKDSGQFVLALAHERPKVWLVGQISAEEGLGIGRPMYYKGTGPEERATWWRVSKADLHPLPQLPKQPAYAGTTLTWMTGFAGFP